MISTLINSHIKLATAIRLAFIAGLFFSSPAWSEPDSSGHLKKAMSLSSMEKWQESVSEYQHAIKENPKDSMAWANMGISLSMVNNYKEALLALDEALKLGYDSATFRHNRGLIFAKLKLYDEAITELETALKMNPFLAIAEYDLGVIFGNLNRTKEAIKKVGSLYYSNNKIARKLFEQIPSEYTIGSIDNGGTLSGQVVMKGEHPRPRAFHLVHTPNVEYCSRISDGKGHRIVDDFALSDKGGLKDTVIAIMGIKKGKPFTDSQKIQSIKIDRCNADQYVMGINNGKNVLIENLDPVEHEISTYEFYDQRRVYYQSNGQLLANTSSVRSAFVHPEAKEYFVTCSLHPFIQTRALILDNPYYTVSDADGRFNIPNVPPGTYEVMAWHPYIPAKKGTISIQANQEAGINFEFDSNDERRKLYSDDLVWYRFQPWYDSTITFYGTTRVDDKVEVLQQPLQPTPLSRYGGFPENIINSNTNKSNTN